MDLINRIMDVCTYIPDTDPPLARSSVVRFAAEREAMGLASVVEDGELIDDPGAFGGSIAEVTPE